MLIFCHTVVIRLRKTFTQKLKNSKIMESLEIEISVLQETLVDCELTIAERVEIREEIAELEAELAFAWADVAMENASRLNS